MSYELPIFSVANASQYLETLVAALVSQVNVASPQYSPYLEAFFRVVTINVEDHRANLNAFRLVIHALSTEQLLSHDSESFADEDAYRVQLDNHRTVLNAIKVLAGVACRMNFSQDLLCALPAMQGLVTAHILLDIVQC